MSIDTLGEIRAIRESQVTYSGQTSADGDASGLTLICAALAALPNYSTQQVKILSGGAIGQVKNIVSDIAGTLAVDAPFTDATGAAQQILAGTYFVIISRTAGGGADHGDIDFLEGFPYINECWEPANIDLNVWTPTHPATNPLAVLENTAPRVGYSVVEFNVEDAEFARLIGRASVNRWRVVPTLMGLNHSVKQFLMEWEIYFHNIAHVDDAHLFMGLVTTAADTRVSTDIIGFGVTLAPAWGIDTITDLGGVGRLTIGLGVAIFEDTMNKLRILIDENNVYFYINEVMWALHPLGTLPDQLMYPCFYMPSAGGGADDFEFYLGAVRIGYVDIP